MKRSLNVVRYSESVKVQKRSSHGFEFPSSVSLGQVLKKVAFNAHRDSG